MKGHFVLKFGKKILFKATRIDCSHRGFGMASIIFFFLSTLGGTSIRQPETGLRNKKQVLSHCRTEIIPGDFYGGEYYVGLLIESSSSFARVPNLVQLSAVGIQSTTITSCCPSCIWEYVLLKQLSQMETFAQFPKGFFLSNK